LEAGSKGKWYLIEGYDIEIHDDDIKSMEGQNLIN
jgi:hypothetical protein